MDVLMDELLLSKELDEYNFDSFFALLKYFNK